MHIESPAYDGSTRDFCQHVLTQWLPHTTDLLAATDLEPTFGFASRPPYPLVERKLVSEVEPGVRLALLGRPAFEPVPFERMSSWLVSD